jgi:hypothetical protein
MLSNTPITSKRLAVHGQRLAEQLGRVRLEALRDLRPDHDHALAFLVVR